MNKASIMDCDLTVRSIMESEMGFLLLEANEASIYDILVNKTSYQDRQGMYGNGSNITYHLYPLMYSKNIDTTTSLVESRANAIDNIFKRWTSYGYNKRNAKNHFACKAFTKYLEEIEFLKADYMLLLVD